MKTISLSVALLATMATASVQAQDPPKLEDFLTKEYDVCMDKSGGVTASMLDCMGEEYGRQDKVMNANYQALIKAYGAKSAFVAKLRKAQRLWAAMVEGEADMMGHPQGGSSQAFNTHGVTQKAVVLRGQEFNELLLAKTQSINSNAVRRNWSHQQRECSASRHDSGMVCDSKTLPFARKTLDANAGKLIAVAKKHGYSNYLRDFAKSTRAWNAYSTASCAALVAGRIYASNFACLEDAVRNRNDLVVDALELLTTGD